MDNRRILLLFCPFLSPSPFPFVVVQLITKQQNRLTEANRFGNQRTSVVVAKSWFRIPDSVRSYNNLGIGVSMEIVRRKQIIINTNLFDEHCQQIAEFIV